MAAAPNALPLAFSTSWMPKIKNGCFISNVPTKDFTISRGEWRQFEARELENVLIPIQSTIRTINSIPVAENNAYTCAAVTKSEHIIAICLLCDAISLPYLTKHTKVIVRPDKQLFHHEYVIGAWSLEGTG